MGLRTQTQSLAIRAIKRAFRTAQTLWSSASVSDGEFHENINETWTSQGYGVNYPYESSSRRSADTEALEAELDALAADDPHHTESADDVTEELATVETDAAAPADASENTLGALVENAEADALRGQIVDAIKTLYDPEIPVNIYELGLIYGIDVHEGNDIRILMTLTSPNCPAAQSLPAEVKTKTSAVDTVRSADVEIVWDPVWGPHLMTEEARLELNL